MQAFTYVVKTKTYLFDHGLSLESKLVVIIHVGKFPLGDLDTARTRYIVDASFFEHIVEQVALLFERRCANFATIVKEGDAKQLSLAVSVVPSLDVGFLYAPRLDGPFVRVRRKSFNRVDVGMSRRHRRGP